MLGRNRQGDYRNGTPIILPKTFGTPITEPHEFGNPITLPHDFGNDVTWLPNPAYFGNVIGGPGLDFLTQEDDVGLFLLEDGSGFILLEN